MASGACWGQLKQKPPSWAWSPNLGKTLPPLRAGVKKDDTKNKKWTFIHGVFDSKQRLLQLSEILGAGVGNATPTGWCHQETLPGPGLWS